ncbi:MAG TPA: hypothetical protein VKE29_09045 [Candidatus Udaeobacter sp.]|nr:hypothetical protein [Candidatus Udaeobacter sp.]
MNPLAPPKKEPDADQQPIGHVSDVKKLALKMPYTGAVILRYVLTGKWTAIDEVIREFSLVVNELVPGKWYALFEEIIHVEFTRYLKGTDGPKQSLKRRGRRIR